MPRPPVYNGVPFGLGAAVDDFGYTAAGAPYDVLRVPASGGAPVFGPIAGALGAITLGTGDHVDTTSYVSPTITSDLMLSVADGTSATPSVVNGAPLMVDKHFVLSSTGCQGVVDPNCGSAFRSAAYGKAANEQQVVGVFGIARNDSAASAGGGSGDVVGVYGHGQITVAPASTKAKSALGGFFTARREVAPSSNFITMAGVELQVADNTGTDCLYDAATAGATVGPGATGSACIGAFLVHNDLGLSAKGGVGVVTRAAGTVGWQVGHACSNVGGASITCFDDISAAVNSFRARGSSYTDVIDLTAATASGSGIKLPAANAGKISWTSMLIDPTFPLVNPVTDNTGQIGSDAKRWNLVRGNAVKANTFVDAAGTAGASVTKTVRDSLGLADCTMTFSQGLLTASTCA